MVSLARTVLEWGNRMAARIINFKSVVRQIAEVPTPRYPGEHPEARVDAYPTSDGVRPRIVDPAFERQGLRERQAIVLRDLIDPPKDVVNGIGVALPIAPAERETSMLSLEFDDPSRRPL